MLASAEAVLARDGLSASMRAIAGDAGAGLGTIYRNFPTQEVLYQAIIIRRTEALIAEAAEAASGQLAVGCYLFDREKGRFTPAVIDVLTLEGEKISAVTAFLAAEILPQRASDWVTGAKLSARFGLPASLL